MEWQHADEQAVLTWTVKAIDRNILCSGLPSLISGGIALLLGICFLWVDIVLASAMFFGAAVAAFLFYKIGMEKTVFVYRATEQRLELCQWQDIPDLVFTFLRVFPFLVVGIILMTFISSPGLSIAALVGPALVGILIASVGADSGYKKIYKNLEHSEYRWNEVIDAMLDEYHGLVLLRWPYELPPDVAAQVENPEQYNTQGALLYFRRDQQDKVVEFVKRKLPAGVSLEQGRYKYEFVG
ncbi:hypothetical protein CK507_02945 [Pseudomonas sp. WN033]|nr:hypothetical protein CK507_02945 [Pseudomonas sp. WN033]